MTHTRETVKQELVRANAAYRRANFSGRYLSEIDFSGLVMRGAIMCDADMDGSDLTGACLWGTVGNNAEIRNIGGIVTYDIAYTFDRLQIGCENHAINAWWLFTDKEILKMDGQKALTFWRKNKQLIKDHIVANPATPTGHEIQTQGAKT